MYEYVQTATGWVLCWGGESLYLEAGRREVVATRDAGDAAAEKAAADHETMQTLSA